MIEAKKIAYNTIIQTIGKAANILIGVLAIAFLTRYLSPEGYGKYTTVLSFLQIFGILFDFGLYLVLLQEISKKDIDKNYVFSNVVTLRIFSGIIFFIIIPLVVVLFPYSRDIKFGIVLTSLAFFLNSMIQVYSAVFQKEMRMDKVVTSEIIAKIVFLALIILFIFLRGNLILVLMANNINSIIFFVILALYSKKYVKFDWSFDLRYWKNILRISWPIGVTTILNLIYFKADTLILSLYKTQTDVGYYGAAYKVLEVITALPHLILGLVLPIFTIYWLEKKQEDLKNILQDVFNIFVVITFLILVIFISEAKGIIYFIAGREYTISIGLLQILIWPTAIIFFSALFNYGIIAVEKQKALIKYFLISAIISLFGYFVFIPKFGYYGAAYTTLFVELLMALFSYLLLRHTTKWNINFKIFLKTGIISIFVFAVLQILSINFILEMIIGFVLYFALLIFYNVLSKDFIKELLNFKKFKQEI